MPKLKGAITGVAIGTALAGGLVGMSALTTTASAASAPVVVSGDHCRSHHHFRHHHHRGITVRVENRNCTNNVNLNDNEEKHHD